jgi:hypothetical protein
VSPPDLHHFRLVEGSVSTQPRSEADIGGRLLPTLCRHQLRAQAAFDVTQKADIGLIGTTGSPSRVR